MIRQFHEFFNLIFGGFMTFGPTGTHSSPPSSAAAAPSSVSLSEPRAGALLLLPLLFGTVLYVDIESESSTRKSRRARFPLTSTVHGTRGTNCMHGVDQANSPPTVTTTRPLSDITYGYYYVLTQSVSYWSA